MQFLNSTAAFLPESTACTRTALDSNGMHTRRKSWACTRNSRKQTQDSREPRHTALLVCTSRALPRLLEIRCRHASTRQQRCSSGPLQSRECGTASQRRWSGNQVQLGEAQSRSYFLAPQQAGCNTCQSLCQADKGTCKSRRRRRRE